jgi:hypothetical protein
MVDLTHLILGHSIDSIGYAQVETYFSDVRDETNNLEFKSYTSSDDFNKNFENLLAPICSFLNSDGGVLIWGAPKTTRDGKRRFCQGPLSPLNSVIEKDDLLRKLVSKISPMPAGIRLQVLQQNGSSIVIMEVQKSEYRPHQVEGIYYMRVDANTLRAPHYFVEALFRRITYPDLSAKIQFEAASYDDADRFKSGYTYRIDFNVIIDNNSPLQNEEFLKYMLSCDIGTPINHWEKWPKPEFEVISNLQPRVPPMEILHFGLQNVRSYSIGFRHQDLRSEGFIAKIILQFGGRYSPLKYCYYSLDLSFINPDTHIERQKYPVPTNCIKAKENILMTDADFSIEDVAKWESIEY